MTIASEITRINTNIANAYTAAEAKGATIPSTQNSANLATCINSISGGSSPTISSLSVTPTTSEQTFNANNVDGYKPVTVSAVTSSIDSNITAGNIKKNVTILGVTGSYEGSGGGGSGIGPTREVSQQGVYQMPTSSGSTFSLPSNATDVGAYALYYAFYNSTGLTSVDLSSLTTVSGSTAFRNAFYNSTGLTSVDLSSLTTVSGSSAFYNAFYGCTSLTSVDLSSLTTVSGSSAFRDVFYGCTSLTSVDLSSLTTVSSGGGNAFREGFYGCASLTSVDLSSLTTVSETSAFYNAFCGCTSLTSISFPALTSNSFGLFTSQFNNMLSGVNGCTVHFPLSLQSVLSTWDSVLQGFSGTNTTVLFDLGACTTTFAITPSTGNEITVNSQTLSGNTILLEKESTANYQIYNSTYGLYLNTYSVPDSDTATITVNLSTTTFNTVTITTGVSDLVVTINDYTLTETSSGVYVLPIYNNSGSSLTLNYIVSGGDNYFDVSGTLTFNTSDITETVTLTPATISTFVRPDLTSNGTLGGNAFAVENGSASTSWRAVDDSSSTYATMNSTYGYEFIFYNPDALKVSQLDLTFSSTTYAATGITIEGSNDGENWTSVNTWSGSASTSISFTVDSSVYYKYHKLTFTPRGSTVRLSDLAITAVYKE